MPKLIKKILLIYISIVLTLAPSSVFAASAGGWAFSSFDVATSVVTALKGGFSASVTVAKSPISKKIAKGIVGGAIAGAALPLAISQISGLALDAIDWVLDSANNAVKWKPKDGVVVGTYVVNNTYSASTAQAACELWNAAASASNGKATVKADAEFCKLYGGAYNYNGNVGATYRFVGDTNKNWRSIPIPTVADKIYDNAKTDSNSRSLVNDALKEYVNEGSADVALDNAKADADATHGCGTGTHWSGSACVADTPTTPDTPFDPSSIIDAINSVFNAITNLFDAVMSIPDVINTAIDKVLEAIASITDVINTAIDDLLVDIKDFFQPVIDKVTDFVDWVKADPDPQTDSKPDIDTAPPTKSAQDFDSNYINFGGQCPSFSSTTISVGMVAVPISFNAQPLCDFAILCRPIILALAYFAAMAIVANAIRSE